MALIAVKNLSKIFEVGDEKVRALDQVSLEIAEGEFVSITGPSGGGKSTLMHLLGLLDRQTTGEYVFDGRLTDDLQDSERSRLRSQKIGFVFQNFYLLARANAHRNVCMPLVYAGAYDRALTRQIVYEKAAEALRRVGLGDRMKHKPNELSGGQRQRVAIARALVNNPALVFADEPTGNLDSNTGHEILKLFQTLHQEGRTIILVTHDPRVASVAGRRIRMLDGKIVEDSYAG